MSRSNPYLTIQKFSETLSFYRAPMSPSLHLKPNYQLHWSHTTLQWRNTRAAVLLGHTATRQAQSSCTTLFSPSRVLNLTPGWDNSHGTPQSPNLIVSQRALVALLLCYSNIFCSLFWVGIWDWLFSEACLRSRPQAQPEPQASNSASLIGAERPAPLRAVKLPWQPFGALLLLRGLDHHFSAHYSTGCCRSFYSAGISKGRH